VKKHLQKKLLLEEGTMRILNLFQNQGREAVVRDEQVEAFTNIADTLSADTINERYLLQIYRCC
jgi:hypothetical protein